jgi:hypothetical protein
MTYFHDLREDVRNGAHAPDLDAVHRTARRRRQTRLSVTAAAAAVVVVAGTYAVAHPRPQTASDAEAVRGPIDSTAIPVTKSMKLLALYPLDTQTTYAVASTANGGYAILRTTDSGREWTAWALPQQVQAQTNPETLTGDVHAAGESLDRFKDPTFLTDLSFTVGGYLTRDGAQSWRQLTTKTPAHRGEPRVAVGPDVAAVPAGWRLGTADFGGNAVRLAAVDPATGTWHQLATQPAGISAHVVSPDGTIWTTTFVGKLSYQSQDATTTGVAVSHDRGRTWRTYTLPRGEGSVGEPLVGLDGEHAFADVMVASTPPNGGLRHAYTLVTADGGKTWTKRTNDRSLPSGGMVLPDGSVLGYNSAETACWYPNAVANKLIITKDRGKTCTLVGGTDNPGLFTRTVSGVYVLSNQNMNPTGYRISTDGIHWQAAPMPPIS